MTLPERIIRLQNGETTLAMWRYQYDAKAAYVRTVLNL